jgi:Lipocalin-like domain
MIIYSPDGHMSAQLQFPHIPPYSGGAFQGSEGEFAESARKTMAYTGPFYLEEVPGNKQRLYHHMNLSQPPNWLGDTQLRVAEMSDEGEEGLFLTLGPENNTVDGGVNRVVRLRWRKMGDNSTAQVPSKL